MPLSKVEETSHAKAEGAPGILRGAAVHTIPTVKHPEVWHFGVHDHYSEGGAGRHFDLRLGHPETGHAHSWALRYWPAPGEMRLAVQQPTHSVDYMDFSGRIESGYGKGRVDLIRRDKTEVIHADNNHVRFNLYSGKGQEEYLLRRAGGNKWLLHNITPTRNGKAADLPNSKPKYRAKEPDKLDPNRPDTVWQAKIDGAHAIFMFDKPGSQARVFSYRPTERETGVIEHTHRLPAHTTLKTPSALQGSILRGELYGADETGKALEPARIGGILNANVWKSRKKQEEEGPLRSVVFDVVKWKGRNVENEPYSKKLEMLREAVRHAPWLELPRMAHTPEEKQKLFDDIKSGREPTTKEGIIEWHLPSSAPPTKAKFLDEKDVIVRRIFPEKREGMAGGFEFSYTKGGPIVGRVGTGMSHAMKRDMLQNPSKYEGLTARVLMQRTADRYAPRAPKFYGFHPDQDLPHDIKTAAMVNDMNPHTYTKLSAATYVAMQQELMELMKLAANPLAARIYSAAARGGLFPPTQQELLAKAQHYLNRSRNATQLSLANVDKHVAYMKQNYPDIVEALRNSPLGQHADERALVQLFLMSHRPGYDLRDTARALGLHNNPIWTDLPNFGGRLRAARADRLGLAEQVAPKPEVANAVTIPAVRRPPAPPQSTTVPAVPRPVPQQSGVVPVAPKPPVPKQPATIPAIPKVRRPAMQYGPTVAPPRMVA